MKNLVIIRHAKSSWADQFVGDHDRKLNDRGRRDAYQMGAFLSRRKVQLGEVYCSTARRAVKTLKRLSLKYNIDQSNVHFIEALYLANLDDLLKIIRLLPDETHFATVIGHNPGLTHLINYLAKPPIDNLPTMGVFIVQLTIDKWADISMHCASEAEFFYPKMFIAE